MLNLRVDALHALHLSHVHLVFPPQSVRLQMRCTLYTSRTCISPFHRDLSACTVSRMLSTSLDRVSPLSTAIYPATAALHALYLFLTSISLPITRIWLQLRCPHSTSPMRISSFNRQQSSHRCVAHYFTLSDVRLLFQLLAIRLRVDCPLSNFPTHVSLFHC